MNQDLSLKQMQTWMENLYGAKDRQRGAEGTFLWLCEEVGELAAAIRERREVVGQDLDLTPMSAGDAEVSNDRQAALAAEFADVLAWVASLANVVGVDLSDAVRRKYGGGCPGCGSAQCQCSTAEKP